MWFLTHIRTIFVHLYLLTFALYICCSYVMSDSFMTPWPVTRQAPLSMGFSRQEYSSGLPFPSPGDLPDQGIKPKSLALQGGSLLLSHYIRCIYFNERCILFLCWSVYHYTVPWVFVIDFVIKSILSDTRIATPAFSLFLFVWNSFLQPLTLFLCVFISEMSLFYFGWCCSVIHPLSFGAFSPLTFQAIDLVLLPFSCSFWVLHYLSVFFSFMFLPCGLMIFFSDMLVFLSL